MKFVRRHRFKFVVTFLVIVLIIVSFYMLWVKVPYTRHQNRLDSIRNTIINENEYIYQDYFNAYNSDQTYFILYVEEDEEKQYVVFDHQRQFITSYAGEVVTEESVLATFTENYEVEPTSIEVGFENERFVYCIKYREGDTLLFAFYSIDNGQFIKSYHL